MIGVGISEDAGIDCSRIALINTKSHMDRGGSPVNKIATIDNMALMITCQPMARYFS
jgi:hypothetical protein